MSKPENSTAKMPNSGFVAGTLIHTQTGLKPIEQIQVGDFVLSKPEIGFGEVSYKRVVNTFVHENKQICLVDYCVVNPLVDGDEIDFVTFWEGKDDSYLSHLVVTANHPFWVNDIGLIGVEHLQTNYVLELKDGTSAVVLRNLRILVTEESGVGWTCEKHEDFGPTIDLRNDTIVVSCNEDVPNDYLGTSEASLSDVYMKRCVYNFEVEDFHTYYVGEEGVWVHNAIQQTS